MKRRLPAAIFWLSVLAAGNASAEALWAKPGVTLSTHSADKAECTSRLASERSRARNAVDAAMASTMSLGVLGAAVTSGLANSSIDQSSFARCMKQKGYVIARLTPKEQREFDALSASNRDRWLQAFFSSDRLPAATTPLTPFLPEAPDETVGTGVFRIVPGTVHIEPGVKEGGEVLFTARGTFAEKAILRHDINYNGGALTVAAGEIFYRVVVDSVFLPLPVTYWCAKATAQRTDAHPMLCITNDMDGYIVQPTISNKADISLTPRGRPNRERLILPVELDVLSTEKDQAGDISYSFDKNGLLGRATIDGKTFETFYPVDVIPNLPVRLDVDGRTISVLFKNSGLKQKYEVAVSSATRSADE